VAEPVTTAKGGELQLERGLNLKSVTNLPTSGTKQEPGPKAKTEAKPDPGATPKSSSLVAASSIISSAKALPGTLPATAAVSRIDKQERIPSPAERAEAYYQQGREAQHAGRADEALTSYQTALALFPEHAAARQALAAVLIEGQRWDAAGQVLREGIELPVTRLASTLTLARLLVERGQAAAALDLMEKQAASGERSAEYQGFLAVLLNRAGRVHEAVERYQAATRLAPAEARWWAGLGIALDADGQGTAAREAYLKARSLPGLPPELAQHVEQRLH
jgi:MSHA biogenesis protein MshN